METNEALPEYQKDFTIGLVAGWVNSEVAKVKEHEQNCFNVKAELESKVFEWLMVFIDSQFLKSMWWFSCFFY